jgi:adenylylsulfate kinase-like enzyme
VAHGSPCFREIDIVDGIERRLFDEGVLVYTLDGDNMRHGLNSNLGFSPEDRRENIRRVGEVAALFADAGIVCITAFISPYRADRAQARAAAKANGFYEVYISRPHLRARDPKGSAQRPAAGISGA